MHVQPKTVFERSFVVLHVHECRGEAHARVAPVAHVLVAPVAPVAKPVANLNPKSVADRVRCLKASPSAKA